MEERTEEGKPMGAEEAILLCESEYKSKGNCICKIDGSKAGSGFFCKIERGEELIPVLITNYHVIDDNFLNQNKYVIVYINDKSYKIDLNSKSKIYSSPNNQYDMMIIKIKEGLVNDYLEIDKNIFNDNSEYNYENASIYILHYANAEEAKISFGKGLKKENDYDIKHLCHTEIGSSGGPILSRMTNKVIGIHKGSIGKGKIGKSNCNYNIGTFLKYPLNEVKNQNKQKKNGPKVSKDNNYYLI